ncbi:MAG: hypothetical protein A3F31_04515 [Candidatus Levybacteria bacterium RIFCSPHIGHO2_12_FULL_38_12]|nr:MAG: hypothetical protein A2770_04200 [Candidatus Levybacteria bacterium RIFCSPHIGHO2_01_FULL_38_12]OGH21827.1 MAG: hypothetical protein A3D75_01390 [Candidatus Levybacteria bacterium RIFCSPHIGHO2_02_FULL_37_18]OGH22516.1 MAG: hypothetical protein A3F31_04515 [Candidatus Levybacteria bacterium RIFCSPHIGHO2_12_FULL_38_12]OGH33448.1 MAG: hypothetical protein A3A47_04340 [Candidatus Levybacteria bacterium RIFCSPLOWO2_01_FULL_37_20]OGH44053.1 MAG: hypothetical protein A3J14_04885 [Candidatus Lev
MKLSRKLYILLFVVLFIVIAVYGYSLKENPIYLKQEASINTNKSIELKPLVIDQKDLEGYYRVYKNPYVVYLRKALNAYLVNDSSEVTISMTAIQKDNREGIISGLDSFEKDYYKSKFVVLTINGNIGGGKDIQIIFQEKPDRIFYAWVYDLADGTYELRGFNSKEHFDEKAMKETIDYYKPYLFDKEHAL